MATVTQNPEPPRSYPTGTLADCEAGRHRWRLVSDQQGDVYVCLVPGCDAVDVD